MQVDAAYPTQAQQQALCTLLYCALTEIRYLAQAGKAQQAADLADMVHNLPRELWTDYFSVSYFRTAFVEPYYRRWPQAGLYDYHQLLTDVAALK